ncbi:unknown [Clostridium sp. CAG:594]|nr:unknown [Clostridium sp. CAG:594]
MVNDDLKKINISKECLEVVKNTFDYDTIVSLAYNYENINNNIKMLKSYGLKDIDRFFIEKNHIFLIKSELLAKKFSKFNIPVFMEIINNDYSAIDKIF